MKKPDQILMATANPGKIREMRALLEPLDVILLGINDLEEIPPLIDETGMTFYENCLIKAVGYSAWSGMPVIAEDSGLCVPALDGAPGVFSARYAGVDGDDAANNNKLLNDMVHLTDADRAAYYHTTAIYLEPQEADPVVAEGQWHGHIVTTPAGDGGFGYDPLFWVSEHQCTSAQLDPKEKNRLSHRAKAMHHLIAQLQELWL